MPKVRGRRGHSRVGDGLDDDLRIGGFRHLVVNELGIGRFFELVAAGKVWTTLNKAVTVAATHNSPIAVNTATPVVGFINPTSDLAAVLIRGGLSTVSGTPAGGQGVLNTQAGIASKITAAATGSIFNNLLQSGASPQGSRMKPMNGVALAGWVATPDAVIEANLVAQATAAAAAGSGGVNSPVADLLDGLHIIPPGGLCAIMAGSGAGTSWIVNGVLTWAEIEWPFHSNESR